MKRPFAAVFGIVFLVAGTAYSQQKETFALIVGVKGTVDMTRGGTKSRVKINDLIKQGDLIETADGSSASVQLSSGVICQVGPKSAVRLVKLDRQGDTLQMEMDMKKGSVATSSGKQPPKGTYIVNTPTSVAAVRGTEFIVEASENKSDVLVNNGSVAVSDPDHKQEEVCGPGGAITATHAGLKGRILEEFEKGKFAIMKEMENQKKANLDAVIEQVKKNQELLRQQKEMMGK